MKQITNKQYDEWQRFKNSQLNGRTITPDGLRVICEGMGKDPEQIGKHMLEVYHKFQQEGVYDIPPCEDDE